MKGADWGASSTSCAAQLRLAGVVISIREIRACAHCSCGGITVTVAAYAFSRTTPCGVKSKIKTLIVGFVVSAPNAGRSSPPVLRLNIPSRQAPDRERWLPSDRRLPNQQESAKSRRSDCLVPSERAVAIMGGSCLRAATADLQARWTSRPSCSVPAKKPKRASADGLRGPPKCRRQLGNGPDQCAQQAISQAMSMARPSRHVRLIPSEWRYLIDGRQILRHDCPSTRRHGVMK